MSEPHALQDASTDNQKALKQLAWAIEASCGRFKLFLARCNYESLRSQMRSSLPEVSNLEISSLELHKSDKTLYTTIRSQLGEDVPAALMVFGLESVSDIDHLLTATNQVREEFRKNFHFPVVLWVSNRVFNKLMHLAPDFESWAVTVTFGIETHELIEFLQQKVEQFFNDNLNLASQEYEEIKQGCYDLQICEQCLKPELKAIRETLLGLTEYHNYKNRKIYKVLKHYKKALKLWQYSHDLERQGKILREITFCYYIKALHYQDINHRYWRTTKHYLQQCLNIFEQTQRPELVANSILKFDKILRQLQDWEQLKTLSQKALLLHKAENKRFLLSQDYGFLAEVAIAKEQWTEAEKLAQKALLILDTISSAQFPGILTNQSVISYTSSSHRFLLAQAQKSLDKLQEAVCNFERAKQESSPEYDTHLYINILSHLQRLYFEQKEYRLAFKMKLEQQSIEQQYGLRAFIGAGRIQPQRQEKLIPTQVETQETVAPEITASGRQLDVERLIERIGRNDCKLIVIYGQSGVGKSSLVNGGLVPALKQKVIGTQAQDVLPVAMRVYTNWVEELGRLLAKALAEKGVQTRLIASVQNAILEEIKQNESRRLRTVLIFDQFEEFFFVYRNPEERRQFFEFVGACLNILPVKVILSLREDYLHYLLECNNLQSRQNSIDILSKEVLYPLGNFSPNDAKSIIQRLTKRSHFQLEPALIERLVEDLASDSGEVRPIELQIVGAQLQTEEIATLAKYQELGTKEELVKRYLAEVVLDCGTENKQTADLVLYLLTDEKGTRPLKTRDELARDLKALAVGMRTEKSKLDLVLEIFVDSGLVLLLKESPDNRYQLVHDYIAAFIRQQQEPKLKELMAELEKERNQRRRSEAKLNRVLKRQLTKAYITGFSLFIVSVVAVGLWFSSEERRKRVEIAEIEALTSTSEARLASNNQIEALVAGIKAGKKIQKTVASPPIEKQTLLQLRETVAKIQELNRLEGHSYWVLCVRFSPDGHLIASASADKTIKLWKRDGSLLKTLTGHSGDVWMVSFSPDGQLIASASSDKTVKLWKRDGTLLKTLLGHKDEVTSVSFSSDGKTLASTSVDGTIRLWNRNGTFLKKIQAHKEAVMSASFSPDGQTLASASVDRTIKLWNLDGTLRKSIPAHKDVVWSVSFSPDGRTIASASWDNSIKLWNHEGKFLRTLKQHTYRVLNVSFSSDSKILVSAGLDGNIFVWRLVDGKVLATFRGHTEGGVKFVDFSPDNRTIVSAGLDKTIRLWKYENPLIKSLLGHSDKVASVSFTPDGQILASANADKTVKLWKRNGTLLATLQGHTRGVTSVSFSPDGQILASASVDTTLKLWKRNGKGGFYTDYKTLKGHSMPVWSVKFSPDGQTIASAGDDRTIKLWSRDGRLLKTLQGHQEAIYGISFSSDSKILVSGSNDKTIKLWSRDGRLLKSFLAKQETVNSVIFSPNDQYIASLGSDNTINLWSRDGILLKKLSEFQEGISSINFSPDSQLLVSAPYDGPIKLWSLDGELLQTLQDDRPTWDVSFSPDGQMLASGSDDGTVKLWKLDRQKLNILAVSDLDNLLLQGCSWLHPYLMTNPNVRKTDSRLCDGITSQN